jgi:hypothetical protein
MRDADGTQRYLDFLSGRDGEPDFARHTLTRREAFFAALARDPVRSRRRIDRETFLRNLDRGRPEPGLDDRMLWLLATAKANQAERFGIGLAELYGRIRDDSPPVQVHLQLQETYHTRILADVVAIFGLPVHARPPVLLARMMIRWIISVPEAWRLPVAGCGEMAGCVLFRALRERGLALFADEPEVAGRIRLLYDEILADEISHVGFIAWQLGPRGRALMRGLYRALGARLVGQMPEAVRLFGRTELARRFGAFRLEEMAREYPRLAFTAATI